MKLFFVTTGGGLGNQIMSYALWLYLKKSGYRTVFYLRKNHLERIFDIKDSLIKFTWKLANSGKNVCVCVC